jgi:hypothetical protein
MRNYLIFGPVRIRISSKHLASWGFARISIGGLSLWSWSNSGELILASYHPRSSLTWLWSVALGKRKWERGWVQRDPWRRSQWHDYYRLPFGRELRISRQNFMARDGGAET